MDTPKATTPYWGAQTSYLNFCEEDYLVTRYIAEFINTLSSLSYIVYGIYGLWRIRGSPQFASRSISYYALMGVGVCSSAYHMTLKYHTQMSDELSMHILITPLIYRTLTYKTNPQYTKMAGIGISIMFTIVMVTHMVLDEFLLHATTFGLGAYFIATRPLVLIRECDDAVLRKKIRNVIMLGTGFFLFGYFAWLVDSYVCGALTDARRSVGLPWAFLLELHGWWHIFTCLGGYIAVVLVDMITSGEPYRDPVEIMAWPVPFATKLVAGTSELAVDKKQA